jgi:hypothetical protein
MLARYKTWVRRNRALLSALEQGAAGLTWLVPEGGNSDVYMVRPTPQTHPLPRAQSLQPPHLLSPAFMGSTGLRIEMASWSSTSTSTLSINFSTLMYFSSKSLGAIATCPLLRCHTLAPSQIVTGYSCIHHTHPVVRGRRPAPRRVT